MKTAISLVTLFALATPAFAHDTAKDETAIKATLAAIDAGWAEGDVKATAAAWAEDGVSVTPMGDRAAGRVEIERSVASALSQLKGSTHTLTVETIHFIKSDVAVVDGTGEVTGAGPAIRARVTFVMSKIKGKWLAADSRGYTYLPKPTGEAAGGR